MGGKKKLWTLKPAYLHILCSGLASQVVLQVVKNPSTCQCRRHRGHGFDPWVGNILLRRKWQPTLILNNHMDRGHWRAIIHGVVKS